MLYHLVGASSNADRTAHAHYADARFGKNHRTQECSFKASKQSIDSIVFPLLAYLTLIIVHRDLTFVIIEINCRFFRFLLPDVPAWFCCVVRTLSYRNIMLQLRF